MHNELTHKQHAGHQRHVIRDDEHDFPDFAIVGVMGLNVFHINVSSVCLDHPVSAESRQELMPAWFARPDPRRSFFSDRAVDHTKTTLKAGQSQWRPGEDQSAIGFRELVT